MQQHRLHDFYGIYRSSECLSTAGSARSNKALAWGCSTPAVGNYGDNAEEGSCMVTVVAIIEEERICGR